MARTRGLSLRPGSAKTVHWHKNAGSDDVLFATADLVKKASN
jgi:hypothetical protein